MTKNHITLFMWGFQEHFRLQVERTVKDVLSDIGIAVEPVIFLVGLLLEGRDNHPICVEPEDGPVAPSDFAGVRDRAKELVDQDPDSQILHSDARTHRLRQQGVRNRAAARAFEEALALKLDLDFSVAMPTAVGDYQVFTAIGLPRSIANGIPSLTIDVMDNLSVGRSLLEGVLGRIRSEVSRALYEPDAGSSLRSIISGDQVAHEAGDSFVLDTAYRADHENPSFGLFDALNRLATTAYEHRNGVGRLILARSDAAAVDRILVLDRPIPLKETRTLRKLLEMSDLDGLGVLANGRVAYGLGRLNNTYDPTTESVFEIVVSGPGSWDLRHDGIPLMAVAYGAPHLPSERLSRDRFVDAAERVFANHGGCDPDRLWRLAMAASKAEHGTMLVVSAEASAEAARLQGQALLTNPVAEPEDLVRNLSRIDGALLVDPQGTLVACGVILDGEATAEGSRARGARFNSAVRYRSSHPEGTLIVLVSEDGMLDVIPRLRPRVRRSDIQSWLNELRAAANLDPVNAERFHRASKPIKDNAFYLSQAECDEVNGLVARHQEQLAAAGLIQVIEPPLKPDPAMSDEYLLD